MRSVQKCNKIDEDNAVEKWHADFILKPKTYGH
jgi:hypothetical protein